MNKDITNELLAAYAEGKVSESERKVVRHYLTGHPDELEDVMMMMDEDYELNLDDEDYAENKNQTNVENSFSNICYSAAAFAPRTMSMKKIFKSPPKIEKSNFKKQLDDLLDDIIG